ncbi:hypothetical protein B0H21DRAFT_781395 [Amylocystis lapponica]|nr:hypothetical protein B0H21DRAFT_781395 [Amylocystis lapponica]
MRQTGMTDADARFRTALANMRYKACTVDDIQLLRSRIIRPNVQRSLLTTDGFRNVSIITARNTHRDAINNFMIARFAKENGEDIHYFHSVDRWTARRESQSMRQDLKDDYGSIEPTRTSDTLLPEMQTLLWNHHAGVLALCRNMPVLLKTNHATELCATNGAEAVVVSWDAHRLPTGQEVLDTLFVKLINPAREIALAGLDPNVIPLIPAKKRVGCIMPSDRLAWIERQQVMVLQNFAMTDYASQGRTRLFNPCHLRHCRGHQSMYTALSRSSSIAGTAILDRFEDNKITGGASGSLRREFRELEVLDEVTRLQFETPGILPFSLAAPTRASVVSAYQAWRGPCHVPARVETALRWESDPFSPPDELSKWMLVTAAPKRPRTEDTATERPKKKPKKEKWVVPPDVRGERHGLIWDSENWSCAYDSLMTIMWNMFTVAGNDWLHTITSTNTIAESVVNDLRLLEVVRNRLRDLLFTLDGQRFPRHGPCTASVLCTTIPYGVMRNTCMSCPLVMIETPLTSCVWSAYPSLWHPDDLSAGTSRVIATAPPVLALEIFPPSSIYPHIVVSPTVNLSSGGIQLPMALAGVVYAGFNHFTCRVVDRAGLVWYNDGASTGRHCILENNTSVPPSLDSSGRHACLVIYESR